MEKWKTYSKASSSWENHTIYYDELSVEEAKKLSTPEECARPCKPGKKPKTCHFQWTVEYYHTFGGACKLCKPTTNTSVSSDCQCILVDGMDLSGIITVNRMYPGPAIQICLGDFVVVDVTNKVAGNALGIHWHGIYQRDWQHYDGVPFLTQCPINEGSTFRYQWRAQNPGTHFWHAHSGLHKAEGLHGAIVIRQPKSKEPNKKLYDYDGLDNVMFISDWMHKNIPSYFPGTTFRNLGQDPDNILVNGKGQYTDSLGNETSTPLAVYNVKPGMRYRIRLINGGSFNCPVQMTIQDHNLTIIAVDGEDIVPRIVTTITTFSAERVDFIINASQSGNRSYWIHFRGFGVCAHKKVQQHAILRYIGSELDSPQTPKPSYDSPLPSGIIFNEVNEVCHGNRTDVVCIKNLESIDSIHPRILRKESDMQLYLPFTFHLYDDNHLFEPNTYKRFIVPSGDESFGATMAGISHINPPSPFISQLSDIPDGYICNKTNLPARCLNSPICHCSHVINIPLNAVVDLMLVDVSGPTGISHPFHLHGFGFHVLAQGLLSKVNLTESNIKQGIELDRKEYLSSHNRPPTKDTLAVPSEGYTIARFIADNPGWWLFHCHFLPHLYNGMALVFRVGDQKDLPPTPEGFPKCGNFVPSIHKSNPKARGKM
ncbi:uncharacterized protein LOC103575234 [Microplitis demolitor]|uniref:uncharacterized protein LOC103575234 n=1 Tax=Microplitis demolitor TaxID=69319 RepID=UPI0004CD6CAB|nr:uncharacterized protein LOC103575234 [Microplitis demolitor]